MSNYDFITPRKRHRHLLIVEGKHEKVHLLKMLLNFFPEIEIRFDDILIYGTNIYELYRDIENEYGVDWYDRDVDLSYIVGKIRKSESMLNLSDFTNVILVFDYERHDPEFSEEKISIMQTYFHDATDVGQLYINYPMIESYQDFQELPDLKYADKYVSAKMQVGSEYKNQVSGTIVAQAMKLPIKIWEILGERFCLKDLDTCAKCTAQILGLDVEDSLPECIEKILEGLISEKDMLTAKNQLKVTLSKFGYLADGKNYNTYMRELFVDIIRHNICKANKVQNGCYEISQDKLKERFFGIDLGEILEKQNSAGSEQEIIWVLNTFVLFVPEYNFDLIMS